MNANSYTSTSRRFKLVTALSAIAISLLAFTASAKDEVPQKGTETSQAISSQANDDGSVDTISIVVGVASHLGRYTAVAHVHVLAPVYDLVSNSLIFSFTMTRTATAANGNKWESIGEGTEIVPLDASFAPLPQPWAFSGTYKQADGSIFSGTFRGLDFGDGTNSGTWTGPTLSGGAGKK